MATSLVPVEWRLHCARQFIESIEESANTAWYVWTGDHVSSNGATEVYDMVQDTHVLAYRSMIFGKRVDGNDACLMIRRIPWVSGTVYTMFDHGDPTMHTKDFYCIVDAGAWQHVFKCLDNNNGAPSTQTPNFADIDGSDEVYQTSDGYRWKYMCSADSTTVNRFATPAFFPLVPNQSVIDHAVPGAIDVIRVYDGGAGYRNYLTGTFDGSHIRVNGETRVYSVSGNTLSSSISNFYTGCLLYISAGTGVGGYRRVVNYYSNSSGKFVLLDTDFETAPQNGSEWELYPEVAVYGGGSQSTNAVARALVNPVGNTVYRVEMLSRGKDYEYATAGVLVHSVVGVERHANVVPVYSPPMGHGSDAAAELGATRACLSVKFSNTEGGTIPATNGFRQIGLLRDPVFANVVVNTTPTSTAFIENEELLTFTTRMVTDSATVNVNSNTVTWTGDWTQRLGTGDELLLINDTQTQLVKVSTVTNATHVVVNSAVKFTCTAANAHLVTVAHAGKVIDQMSATLIEVETTVALTQGQNIIGRNSGARCSINDIYRNDVLKEFNTFVQCWKYKGTYTAGTFVEDEYIYQGTSLSTATARAQVHSSTSADGSDVVLTTNQNGIFDNGLEIKGATSGATFQITTKYSPEVRHGSGRVTYIENVDPVERAPDQTESFRLILEF